MVVIIDAIDAIDTIDAIDAIGTIGGIEAIGLRVERGGVEDRLRVVGRE